MDEVLPGDTFSVDTAAIIRMSTPKYPVFDDAYIDFYYFYCPNRIIWDNFKRFMGEADDKPWMPTKTYQVPKIIIQGDETEEAYPAEQTILDYMGVPTKVVKGTDKKIEINALPIRAYVKIWNEFFRDQNVGNPAVNITNDDNVDYSTGTTTGAEKDATVENRLQNAIHGGFCLPVSRFHDYFTSCLPYPQRGPEVTIALTGNAPIKMFDDNGINSAPNPTTIWMSGNAAYMAQNNAKRTNRSARLNREYGWRLVQDTLTTDLSNVEAATINQLRQAFAVQHYYEALARGGSRYREQVRALFGVSISDKTVQVPE